MSFRCLLDVFQMSYNVSTGDLSFEDINLMYDMCRFEKAWDPHLTSVWCAPFDEQDLKVPKG